MVNEIKFMINNTPANDPEHITLMNELKTLNRALNEAVTNLIAAEEEIVNGDVSIARKTKAANTFIDLTIESVLGGEAASEQNKGIVRNDDSDKTATAPATPLSSNKRAKTDRQQEFAPPATPAFVNQSLGFSMPRMGPLSTNTSGEVSPLIFDQQGDEIVGSVLHDDDASNPSS